MKRLVSRSGLIHANDDDDDGLDSFDCDFSLVLLTSYEVRVLTLG